MWPASQITRQLPALILAAAFLGIAPMPSLAHGDLDERIQTLTRQMEQTPDDVNLCLQRADALRRHRDFPAALADVTAAEKLQPHQPTADLQRARIWFDVENFPQALRAANNCLARNAANPDALVLRARSFAHLGRHEEAVKDFSTVLMLAATPLPDLYLERAECQATLGRLDDAVRGLDEDLARLGQTPSLVIPAIEYERRRGAFKSALTRLEKARAFYDRESFLALRGEILLQAGQKESAPAPGLAARLRDGLEKSNLADKPR